MTLIRWYIGLVVITLLLMVVGASIVIGGNHEVGYRSTCRLCVCCRLR